VYAGTRYLRDLLKQFQDTKLALAAYNAGENNVIKYGYKIPPFKETQHYVRKVLRYYEKYQETL
jgi:soluble lytic murein transglycosylase-like protein